MQIETHWFGRKSFIEGESLQREFAEKARVDEQGYLLGFEFNPVITLGKRGHVAKDLMCTPSQIEQKGIEIQCIARGGQATLHSHGQTVIYPVLPLRSWNWGVKKYVRWLIDTTQESLKVLGIETQEYSEPGLYTPVGKIAFFGVRIVQGISQYGISINTANDLEEFAVIRSCGKSCENFDRISNHKPHVTVGDAFSAWTAQIRI